MSQTNLETAIAHHKAGRLDEAVALYRKILATDPDSADANYLLGLIAFQRDHHEEALEYFRRAHLLAPENLKLHRDYLKASLATGMFAEAQRLAEQYISKKPDEPETYSCLHVACYERGGSREVVRNHLRTMAKHCNIGYHYQPGITASLKDRYPELATELAAKRIRVDTKPPLTGKPQLTMAEVVTDQATLIGTSGLTLNGSVGGTTLPTRYRFRYGTASDNLDKTTELKFVPPGRHGRVRDDGANLYDRVYCYSFQVDFRKIESDRGDAPEPRLGNVAMMLLSPFGKDRNHINGIGIVDLLLGWTNAAQVRHQISGFNDSELYPRKAYPGEKLDLRDAELSVTLRSTELDVKDFHLVVLCNSDTGTALLPEWMEDMAPWVLTEGLEKNSIVCDGRWNSFVFKFRDNSNDWSFEGNNVEEMGEDIGRYRYFPLNESLSRHRGNLCLQFVFGKDVDTPDGEVELASLALRYRSRSLLTPGYGTELVVLPADGTADPAHLTAGAIGIDNECWHSGADPETPQEFAWKFTQEASLESVRLFQHPRWPAKEIEVLASDDGDRFTVIWSAELQSDPVEIAATRADSKIRNLASITILDAPVNCRFLKLRILSGHRSEHWGLDAIEAFGEGPPPLPEIEPCSFSEELSGMDPGTIVYYQIVAENDAGTSKGTIESFQVPVDRRPIIHWARVIERMPEKATVLVRLTPMGSFTDLNGCFRDADGELAFAGKVVVGRWDTPKHVTMAVTGLDVGQTYRGVLTAANDAGESDDIEICIEPEIDN